MKKRLCVVLIALAGACVGEIPIDKGAERGPEPTDVGAGGGAQTPQPTRAYPEGPYGIDVGARIVNHAFMGYADDDGDSQAYNDSPRQIALAEHFQGVDVDARVIMMNVSAVWCAPCQVEATHMRAANDKYRGRGARIFTVLLGDINKAYTWSALYDLPTPVLADEMAETSVYLEATPLNLFIDPRDMTILAKIYSEEFQPLLEHYLETL